MIHTYFGHFGDACDWTESWKDKRKILNNIIRMHWVVLFFGIRSSLMELFYSFNHTQRNSLTNSCVNSCVTAWIPAWCKLRKLRVNCVPECSEFDAVIYLLLNLRFSEWKTESVLHRQFASLFFCELRIGRVGCKLLPRPSGVLWILQD